MFALVCKNLLFQSQASAAARAANAPMKTFLSCEAAAKQGAGIRVALVDLSSTPEASAIAALRAACPTAKIVCFGPHVDAEAMQAAVAAGADAAIPNSRFNASLDGLLALASA